MRLPIWLKLGAAFTVVLVMTAAVGFIALQKVAALNENTQALYEDPMVGAVGLAGILANVEELRNVTHDIFLDPQNVASEVQQFEGVKGSSK